MSDITEIIKDLSHRVSEDYLIFGKDMNESLISLVQDGSIENLEILKRICEHANQNVYLALFYNPEVDKSNITFDIANFDDISLKAKKSEEAMKDYNTPPVDYRSALEIAIMPNIDKDESEGEKLSNLNEVVEYRQVFRNLLNRVGIMKSAEVKSAEESLNKMAHDAKALIADGSSLGDISKIATRHIKENIGGDAMKIAECYDIIHKDLVASNFHVKTGFTKISSHAINKKSIILKPVEEFSMAMTKIAGFTEMECNIEKYLKAFDNSVNKNKL